MKNTIFSKLVLLFVIEYIFAIITIFLIIYKGLPVSGYSGHIGYHKSQYYENMNTVADIGEEYVENQLDDIRKSMIFISREESITGLLETLDAEASETISSGSENYFSVRKKLNSNLKKYMIINSSIENLFVAGSNSGDILASGRNMEIPDWNNGYIKKADINHYGTAGFFDTADAQDPEKNLLFVYTELKINGRSDENKYYLTGIINLNKINEKFRNLFSSSGSYLALEILHEDSEDKNTSGDKPEGKSSLINNPESGLESDTQVITDYDFLKAVKPDNGAEISVSRYIYAGSSLSIVLNVRRSTEELSEYLKKEILMSAAVSGLFMTVSLLLVWAAVRGTAKPVIGILNSVDELLKGDYSVRVHSNHRGEIDPLSDSFNSMAELLEKAKERIEEESRLKTKSLEREIFNYRSTEKNLIRLSNVVEQSPSVIIILDLDFKIEYVNPVFTKLTGYELSEVKGRSPDFLSEKSEISENSKSRDLIINSAGETVGTIFHNRKKNGEDFWVSSTISEILDNNGELLNYLEIQQDITEKKKLESRLVQSQKLESMGTLAGGVAHDFNNILSIILGYSDYMLSKTDPESKNYMMITDIKEASERGAVLTQKLMAFSRRQEIESAALDLNDLIMGFQKVIKSILGEKTMLVIDLDPELSIINGDSSQIERVLMNLSVNALHAMKNGGTFTITTHNEVSGIHEGSRQGKPVESVSVSVSDTGCGMDAETVDRIFDPFYTTRTSGEGTGLGLSVVYGIVEQHNGWIETNSVPGEGTEFKIFIPAAKNIIRKEKIGLIERTLPVGNGERILLVEDDKKLRDFEVDLLTEKGFVVFAAGNVDDVFEMFDIENGDFDIVFSDVVLPGVNGVQLAEFLRERNPDLHILMSSGYIDDKSLRNYIREKGYSFIQKPFTSEDLLNRIYEILNEL